MRALFLSLILCCLGVHSSSAVETLVDKKAGKWWVTVWEDEFTKNKAAAIGNYVTDKAIPRVVIGPAQNALLTNGKLVPAPLLMFYGSHSAGDAIGQNTTTLGILVDGVSMAIDGETWKKDLIAAMLKGEKCVIRFQESSSKGLQIVTVSTSLEGFAECWAAIPKELIDLEEAHAKIRAANSVRREMETLVDKKAGQWVLDVSVDEFTKKRASAVFSEKADDTLGSTAIWIVPSQLVLQSDGKLVPSTLIQLGYKQHSTTHIFDFFPDQKIVGILVDDVSMALKGKTWKKDLIAAMLKGKKFVMRVEDHRSEKKRTITTSRLLEGFPECWAAIPKELIDLEEAHAKIRAADSVRREMDNARLSQDLINNGPQNREWTSSDGFSTFEGVLTSYDKLTGKAKIKRKKDRRIVTVGKDRLSESDQNYLSVVGKLGKFPFLSPASRRRFQ